MLRLAAVGVRHGHNWSLVDGLVKTRQAELAAVVEDHPELVAKARERYDVPVYGTVEALLKAEEVHVASLAPTNNRKADAICALARRGVHCLVDKPLATTLDDLARIEAAVRESGVHCVMALPVRFFPAHWAAKRLIDDGAIGDIAAVFAMRTHNLHPETRRSWELNTEENGGPLVDLGSHDYDFAAWCVGSRPVSVFGNASLKRYTDLSGFADAAQMMVRFADGAAAWVCSDWLTPDDARGSATGVQIVGTRGVLRVSERDGDLALLTGGTGWQQAPTDADRPDMVRDFLAGLRGEPHIVTADQCLNTARVLLHGRASAGTGAAVAL